MVSILPSDRTGMDVLARHVGQGISQGLPLAINRNIGMSAIDQLQKNLQGEAGKDPLNIALEFARAGVVLPGMEKALAPLADIAARRAITGGARPTKEVTSPVSGNITTSPQVSQQPNIPAIDQMNIPPKEAISEQTIDGQIAQKKKGSQFPEYTGANPFAIKSLSEMQDEATRYANAVQDPNAYGMRLAEQQKENDIANQQRQDLEQMAIQSGVTPDQLPRYMLVGSQFDFRNPSKWIQETNRAFSKVRANDRKLEGEFIPGIGNGLMGENRQEALKRLEPTVKDQIERGLEQETRDFLAKNYVTPTEIETLIHPVNERQKKNIGSLVNGIFPIEKEFVGAGERKKFQPTLSYTDALEKAPKEMQQFQDILADFFINNVDKDTSLLALRDMLIHDKNYDWRQIGPAIRQAESMGLKLEPHQSTEMGTLETQAPYDSLGDIFKEWARIPIFLRGSR